MTVGVGSQVRLRPLAFLGTTSSVTAKAEMRSMFKDISVMSWKKPSQN